ncbi:MAG: Asp-tRNA(Asn)/Glu-tRNA(Gln) amidotransferase GatCAB subunit A [Alphaproteobacteria bacterium CG_4_10_14_0_2_um_filter_63_37]|nr:MAG: aspartyl/glutamyl-tRNA amidotransferase subunit A [Proteobacteria bacterium CG1_02_64_396]PJA23987.1 MAG: Asp-tRNA(Asn)/Glu-tRNA(Gln) amidotransferase GatCAB subunit A [Alphaproteobacteria bacterium CG_4_10_14_0_2_um_filter_63_37]
MFNSIQAALTALNKGELSSRELTQHYLGRIAAHNDRLNAYITVTAESALAQADAADAARKAGSAGPLAGIPIAQKDIFVTEGVRTTCGSKMLGHWNPPYTATVVEKLNAAGTVMLGKANMDEFAMGSSNETSAFGPVRNPLDETRIPGGSSGGSAAAVAGDLALAATGTDTGGSIRQPAACCGVVGLKPTYGRSSRYGMIAFASSLDQAGPIAKTVADCGLLLNAMAGHDPKDSTSIDREGEDFTALIGRDIKGMKIGLPKEYFGAGVAPDVARQIQAAAKALADQGAEIVEVSLPHTEYAVPAYYIIAPAECSSNLARFDGVRFGHRAQGAKNLLEMYVKSRSEGFGSEVKRRIMLGTYALSSGYYDAYYLKAQKVRTRIREDFEAAFAQVDLLLTPTAPTTAFKIGEKVDDPLTMYLSDIATIPASLAGVPAIAVPFGKGIDGMPIGAQLIGPHWGEAKLLQVAAVLEGVA